MVEDFFGFMKGLSLEDAVVCELTMEHGQTALDEAKTAKLWAKSGPRYWVLLIADEIEGFKGVSLYLHHKYNTMPDEEVAKLVVLMPDRVIQDVTGWFTGTAIEDTFSKAEVKQLYGYFKGQCGWVQRVIVRRAAPPTNHSCGLASIGTGANEGVIDLWQRIGYRLPFKVEGSYDRYSLHKTENRMRIKAVSGICSQCGKMPVDGCEVGIIDSLGEAHAFCNYDCLAQWNVTRGLTPWGELVVNKMPETGDIRCPKCLSENHDSKAIQYWGGCRERVFECKDCGYIFTSWTR